VTGRRRPGILLAVWLLAASPACVSYRCYSAALPTEVRVRIAPAETEPQRWALHVEGSAQADALPDEHGRCVVLVSSGRHCERVSWFGLVREELRSSKPLLRLLRDGDEVFVLTFNEVIQLPLDAEGYRVLDFDA
jgi:hypothetical protein